MDEPHALELTAGADILAASRIDWKAKGGMSMKQILISGLASLLAILLLPCGVRREAPQARDIVILHELVLPAADEQPEAAAASTEETVCLLTGDTIETLPLSAYLTGVVLSEMPPEFAPEALKAQAVAARTFTQKRRQSAKHEHADVCADSACCQAWSSEAALRERFGANYDTYAEKARAAVEATRGEVLLYDGVLIDATYFSCSGGRTEDAAAVWGAEVPYLQSVESYGEENALRYASEKRFTPEALRAALGGAALTGSPSAWFSDVTYTEGGGVNTMKIGQTCYTGTELRRLLGLNSTCFRVSADEDGVTFHVLGYGHRVGMSQYGADYMARQGYDYRTILQYYYRGAELKKADE